MKKLLTVAIVALLSTGAAIACDGHKVCKKGEKKECCKKGDKAECSKKEKKAEAKPTTATAKA